MLATPEMWALIGESPVFQEEDKLASYNYWADYHSGMPADWADYMWMTDYDWEAEWSGDEGDEQCP